MDHPPPAGASRVPWGIPTDDPSPFADEPSYEELKEFVAALQLLAEQQAAEGAELREEVSVLKEKIDVLARTIAELEKKLGRSSQNSSMPPSSDIFAKPAKEESPNRKARRAMGRKPGKQPGAPGAHLAQVADPDEVVPHAPETCRCCGADLSGARLVNEEVRQVFEIPTPKIVVTEHRVYKLRCSCGEMNEGSFPPLTRAPTTYVLLGWRSIPESATRLRSSQCRGGRPRAARWGADRASQQSQSTEPDRKPG